MEDCQEVEGGLCGSAEELFISTPLIENSSITKECHEPYFPALNLLTLI